MTMDKHLHTLRRGTINQDWNMIIHNNWDTVFLIIEQSSPPTGTSGWVIFGMHCASCWSSSVSLTRSSSKVTSPSFKFFPDCKIWRWLRNVAEYVEMINLWHYSNIPSSMSFWRSDGSSFPFILFATAFLSSRSLSTSCYLWVTIR